MSTAMPSGFLPDGRRAAVCLSIDDIHPGRSSDAYEAGGDLERGVLGRVAWLLDRHPRLKVTLFVAPDWRQIAPQPTQRFLTKVPILRDWLFLTRVLPEGTMRLDRHPEFVAHVRSLPRTEAALHGLHHVHRGPRIPVEFQNEDAATCAAMLRRGIEIYADAGLPLAPGLAPPGWDAQPALVAAMEDVGLRFLASARDVRTAVSPDARAGMSGLGGRSLIFPERIGSGKLVHITSNFQANSPEERAFAILEAGGLLAIKAHAVKEAFGHVMLDGLDWPYANFLDMLLSRIEDRFGEGVWWCSMSEVAERVLGAAVPARSEREAAAT
jgi:hypothetical protein